MTIRPGTVKLLPVLVLAGIALGVYLDYHFWQNGRFYREHWGWAVVLTAFTAWFIPAYWRFLDWVTARQERVCRAAWGWAWQRVTKVWQR